MFWCFGLKQEHLQPRLSPHAHALELCLHTFWSSPPCPCSALWHTGRGRCDPVRCVDHRHPSGVVGLLFVFTVRKGKSENWPLLRDSCVWSPWHTFPQRSGLHSSPLPYPSTSQNLNVGGSATLFRWSKPKPGPKESGVVLTQATTHRDQPTLKATIHALCMTRRGQHIIHGYPGPQQPAR